MDEEPRSQVQGGDDPDSPPSDEPTEFDDFAMLADEAAWVEFADGAAVPGDVDDGGPSGRPDQPASPAPPRPVNWNHLSAEEAEDAWVDLNAWVDWLRHTYGLPAAVIPPYWHRHPELVWELSALHTHWLGAYHPEQHASAAIGWHHDFAEAQHRLRDWVAQSGTRLDHDRPLRRTAWPGEHPTDDTDGEAVLANRDEDFAQYVSDDIGRRLLARPGAVDNQPESRSTA